MRICFSNRSLLYFCLLKYNQGHTVPKLMIRKKSPRIVTEEIINLVYLLLFLSELLPNDRQHCNCSHHQKTQNNIICKYYNKPIVINEQINAFGIIPTQYAEDKQTPNTIQK